MSKTDNLLARIGIMGDHELSDCEIEDALKSEGIFVWGPDGERFQRMFAVVMKLRMDREPGNGR